MANTPRQLVAIKMNEPKNGARTGPMITKDCRNVMAVCKVIVKDKKQFL